MSFILWALEGYKEPSSREIHIDAPLLSQADHTIIVEEEAGQNMLLEVRPVATENGLIILSENNTTLILE
jgi:hypothetical protein